MPSVEVLAASCVATRSGWQPLVALVPPNLLVLDRFGTLVDVPIEVQQVGVDTITFLGSRAAFGPFAPETRVLESDGGTCRLGALVDAGDVRDHNYEATISGVAREFRNVSDYGLWHGLRWLACASTEEELVVRCVESSAPVPRRVRSVDRAGIRYLVIPRATLADSVRADWCSFVLELGRALFMREHDDRLEIPAMAFVLGLWYVSALSATGTGFRFAYDTIQHSSYLFVHHTADVAAGGAVPGSTAFRRPLTEKVVRLNWTDPSWNPLVNGFIVVGS